MAASKLSWHRPVTWPLNGESRSLLRIIVRRKAQCLNCWFHSYFIFGDTQATLKDWDGNPDIWRVENGSIVGESAKEKPVGNSYISYHGTIVKDFDLKLEIKVENGGGSGIQYRSQTGLPWRRARPGDAPNLEHC